MKKSDWITLEPSIDRKFFDEVTIKINSKLAGIIEGKLKVEDVNSDGKIRLLASYNVNPFPGKHDLRTFYVSQNQLDLIQEKGFGYVLTPPPKNAEGTK